MVEYVHVDPDDIEVECEAPCKCGGTFQIATLTARSGFEIPHLSHSLPTCPHFDTLSPKRYLAWNRPQGLVN